MPDALQNASGIADATPGARILTVDDDDFALKAMRVALRSAGFSNVVQAHHAADAVQQLASGAVDLLITDVQMPGWNGIEMLRRIRCGDSPAPRDLRVIVHTSFAHRDVMGAALALDVNGFLPKPVRAAMIMPRVEKALKERWTLRSAVAYGAVSSDLRSLPSLQPPDAGQPEPLLESLPSAIADWVTESMQVKSLFAGLTLAADLTTDDGTLLLPKGHVVTAQQISRLLDWDELASRAVSVIRPVCPL